MKKLCFILLLMFLCVTSVFANDAKNFYDSVINGGGDYYGQKNDAESFYDSVINGSDSIFRTYDEQAKQDYSWLTKRWVDAYGNCLIKGNISYKSGDKIYHIPGWKDYKATKINTSYGERWFCTEWEAYQAGWRAPYYANRPKVYPNPYGN